MSAHPLHPIQRSGFTLVELTIVILIISFLAAMSIPAMAIFKRKAAVDATRSLLSQISMAMEAYGVDRWSTDPSTKPMIQPMWDLVQMVSGTPTIGADGLLDEMADVPVLPSPLAGKYFGFATMAGGAINPKHLRMSGTNRDRIVDSWGSQIHVPSRDELPIGVRFGVFSAGPDKNAGTTDDNIYSWK